MEFGLRKRQRGSDAFIVIGNSGMDVNVCIILDVCYP